MKLTTNNTQKKGNKTFVPPSVPDMNKDVRANSILKAFNDMKDKNRLEITAIFDEHTIPSVIPKMKK